MMFQKVPYIEATFLKNSMVPMVPMVLYSVALWFLGTTLKKQYGTYGTYGV